VAAVGDDRAESVRYEESQRGMPLAPLFIVVPIVVLAWFQLIWLVAGDQVILGEDTDSDRLAVWIVWAIAGLGVPLLVATVRLQVEVTDQVVRVRFRPFLRREIPLDRIARVEAVTYRPIWGYGGWGLRLGRGGRIAYSVRGAEGVEIDVREGRHVLIGSSRPSALRDAIEAAATDAGFGIP